MQVFTKYISTNNEYILYYKSLFDPGGLETVLENHSTTIL